MSRWVGPKDILVHIGVHKSGSTALQAAFGTSRAALRRQGVIYPARNTLHWHSSLALLGKQSGWDDTDKRASLEKWERLRGMLVEADGPSILSSEAYCEADDALIDRLVEDLQPKQLKMVVCLRPLSKLLASNWQQYVKTGLRAPYDAWLRDKLLEEGPRSTPSFWKRNRHGELVRRWADKLGRDNVTVVIVDSSERMGIFWSFEDLLGVPRGTITPDPSAPRNRSLSWPEVETMRLLNGELEGQVHYDAYHKYLRRGGLNDLVEQRSADSDDPIVTPDWAVERAIEIGRGHADEIRSLGVNVIGSLDLLATGDLTGQADVNPPVDAIPIGIAACLTAGTLRAIDRERKAQAARPATVSAAGA